MVMEKINIAEILKSCPKGMELNCTLFDNVTLGGVDTQKEFPIEIKVDDSNSWYLTKEGCFHIKNPSAKCVIFPKGKTTWEGFQRPFKDGDIIFTRGGKYNWVSIFKQFSGSSCCTYVDLCITNNDLFTGTSSYLCTIEEIDTQRLATEEEKQKLFDAIKANGYKWNEATKTLEKLVQPKFKVGDRIRHKTANENNIYEISKVYDDSYGLVDFTCMLDMKYQDNYELVPNKFDITTLVPFESKVLVRAADNQFWRPAIWGVKQWDWDFCCVVGGDMWEQCIPYEGNEHLLSTTDDCDEYFKNWQ